jgi:hypothetical protein
MLSLLFYTEFLSDRKSPSTPFVIGSLAAASAVTVAVVWGFVHEPDGWASIAALVVTSPFIAICTVAAAAFAIAVALLPFRAVLALWNLMRANPSS